MKKSAIERINLVVAELAEQAKFTDTNNAQQRAHILLKDNALFSDTLFVNYSDKFIGYVKEVQRNTHS